MAKTVNSAFQEFNRDFVNLDSDITKTARSSRDWLIKQIEKFPSSIDDFPRLYDGMHIKFGSFARNTKIRPLDDIDLIITFSADGATYFTHEYGKLYTISVPEESTNLRKLCNDDGTLNSIKLVNKIVSSLKEIEHYKAAEIHRRQEATTLSLSSYEWNFDIVPAFYTDTGYYLIPDGKGNWKATDPRMDQELVTNCNKKHNGEILQIIRTLKYWNRRAQMSTIPSYLFEVIIINYFNSKNEIKDYIDLNLINFWAHLHSCIYDRVEDPKSLSGNLNDLTLEDKRKISDKALDAYTKANEAIKAETEDKDQQKAINKWLEIFGNDFPKYE
jgi:hypothetical protein